MLGLSLQVSYTFMWDVIVGNPLVFDFPLDSTKSLITKDRECHPLYNITVYRNNAKDRISHCFSSFHDIRIRNSLINLVHDHAGKHKPSHGFFRTYDFTV